MIHNPILPGFNPDPCICKRGDDFYLAVSTFEWLPGIPVYHSRDLKHWELLTHVITSEKQADLKKLPSAKGIWAPDLSWDEKEHRFYVVYGVMNSMNARYFDVDNYLIWSRDIEGPWSEPVYLHSAGFDASFFKDDDGRQYIVSLEWESRDGYEKPGEICLCEYSEEEGQIIGLPERIWRGGTDRGCIEAPRLTKHNDMYYLMCAEGGTGYNHCVTMARSDTVWGPYEKDPCNPILTSSPNDSYERDDPDHLKPKYFNPAAPLQKAGHASYVELPDGEVYLAHLCARPFVPELRCTLGRETAIQKMYWTDDGWLRLEGGGNLAKLDVPEPKGLQSNQPLQEEPAVFRDEFDQTEMKKGYYAPRILPSDFTDLKERPGYLRMRGQEAQTSLNRVSLLARKLTDLQARVTVRMDFHPLVYQHSAGLILYYDNMNYLYLRKYYSQTLGQSAISIIHLENGRKEELTDTRTPVGENEIWFRLWVRGRKTWFEWSMDGEEFRKIGRVFDTTRFSDEFCEYGEFTGTMVGMTCTDRLLHRQSADFGLFEVSLEV